MKRLLIVIAGVLAVVALGAAPAGAATLDSCLAQHHVCVSDSGRQVISTAQKDQLEKQIGNEPIYLVVATSGSATPARCASSSATLAGTTSSRSASLTSASGTSAPTTGG